MARRCEYYCEYYYSTRENNINIFKLPCNVLFIREVQISLPIPLPANQMRRTSGEASPTVYSCYVNFLELMSVKNNQFLKK